MPVIPSIFTTPRRTSPSRNPPQYQSNGYRKQQRRPLIRPLLPEIKKSDTLDSLSEISLSRLPPPPKSTRYVQNGKLKIPLSRSNTSEDLDRRSMSRESSYVSRSPSPAHSNSTFNGNRSNNSLSNYDSWRSSRSVSVSRSTGTPPPRRIFPQTSQHEENLDLYDYYRMEQSPVVFDANLSFVLGCSNQKVKQNLRASPAHSEKSTASAYLSDKIESFLKRTDHVMDEWSALGRKEKFDNGTVSQLEKHRCRSEGSRSVSRSRSSTNILVRGFQLLKQQPSMRRSCSRERSLVETEDDDRTICDEEVGNSLFCFKYRHPGSSLTD